MDKLRAFGAEHRSALRLIAVTLILDALAGVVFASAEHLPVLAGLSWAVGTATTSGSRYVSVNHSGDLITDVVQLTVIPLFAATFTLFTSRITAGHVRRHMAASETRTLARVKGALHEHHEKIAALLTGTQDHGPVDSGDRPGQGTGPAGDPAGRSAARKEPGRGPAASR